MKRGGGVPALALEEAALISGEKSTDLTALDEPLVSLSQLDARQSRVVELRFFGGLTVEETAEVTRDGKQLVLARGTVTPDAVLISNIK